MIHPLSPTSEAAPRAIPDDESRTVGMSKHIARLVILTLAALALVESACLAYPVVRALIIPPRDNAAQRGARLAAELGCFSCHGPGGRGGMPNPGSKTGEVPSFHEGTLMMYAHDDDDMRGYIMNGAPASKLARSEYRAEMAAQLIRMPAFKDVVSAAQLDDLIAFLRASSGLLGPPAGSLAERGAEVATANACFSCHGMMGIGGIPNPGSLKGYIPGFGGEDFDELVRDEDELRGWIRTGGIPRLRNDVLATHFIERQRIQMPAFGDQLSPADLDAVVAYVRWLASGQWQQQALSR
jgi:mono/diheme cytochrome c family protein